MIQHTFPVNKYRPRVIITNVHGYLNILPWARREIAVSGEIGMLKQEGETLVVSDCQRDLIVHIPSITTIAESVFTVTTDVIVNHLQQGASINSAGNVVLADVDGDILLQDIHGDVELTNVNGVANLTNVGGSLQAQHVSRLETRYVGGNTMLSDTTQVNLSAVGGNLTVTGADSVICGAVGSDLEVEHVEHKLQCNTVGGHCIVHESAGANVSIHTIGEDFVCDDAVLVGPCVVGGDLHLQSDFAAHSHLFCHVEGDAHVTLPTDANLALSTTVGGNARGPISTYVRNGGFVSLLYGEGSALFDLTVDGDLTLSGAEPCHSNSEFSWDEFGLRLAEL
jgi:hypothetical protein